MRSVMISLAIIYFSLASGLINAVDDDFNDEMNRSIFGFSADARINIDNLPAVENTESYNDSVRDATKVREQPTDLGILEVFSVFNYLLNAVMFLINTLLNASVNFHNFIHNLGDPSITVIPINMAIVLAVLVNINHLMAIYQLIGKVDFKGGA